MSLAALRSAIVEVMQAALPAIKVAEHGGSINAAEIKKWATQAPAIRVACLGVPAVEINPAKSYLDGEWAAFCIERDRATQGHRDVRVLLLAQSAMAVTAQFGQRFNNVAVSAPTNITARNLYARDIDDMGIALWLVRWRQAVEITSVDVTGLDDFETFFASYPIPPLDDVGSPESKSPVTSQLVTLPIQGE